MSHKLLARVKELERKVAELEAWKEKHETKAESQIGFEVDDPNEDDLEIEDGMIEPIGGPE